MRARLHLSQPDDLGGCWRRGTVPGGFFRFVDSSAERWDPVRREWVRWPTPPKSPPADPINAAPYEPGGLYLIAPRAVGPAPTGPPADNEKAKKPDGKEAAQKTADTYQIAIDRHRDAMRWLIGAAGALAVALVGTAPLTGLPAALASPATHDQALWGVIIVAVGLISALVCAVWLAQPVHMSTAEFCLEDPTLFDWRDRLQARLATAPALYFDARARNVRVRDYRASWIGIVNDIEDSQLRESDETRLADLGRYLTLAKARLDEDAPSVGANIARGAVAKMKARSWLSIAILGASLAAVVVGFSSYQSAAGKVSTPPSISEIKPTPRRTQGGSGLRD